MPRGRPSRATVYRRLDAAVTDLRDRLGGLPTPREAGAVWDDIWHLDGAALLTVAEVRHVHHLTMGPVWAVAPHEHAGADEGPGSFRRHDIAPFPDGMRPRGPWSTSRCGAGSTTPAP